MENYKPLVVSDVRLGVEAINDVVRCLQRDTPLSTDIVHLNYSTATVDEFDKSSQAVVDHLTSASTITAAWLTDAGDRLSRNLDEAGRVQESIRSATGTQRETSAHRSATEERIRILKGDIANGEQNLASAQKSLRNAKHDLDKQRDTQRIVRVGAVASLFFAPVLSIALAAVDLTALQRAVDRQDDAVRKVERELASSRTRLQEQRVALDKEKSEVDRLTTKISELQRRSADLGLVVVKLQSERNELAELSTRINDCLHTVNTALSSSKTITAMYSMRNVVTSLRGVVGALGSDVMFAGPLAQLDDAALGVLDRRVAAIRHRQIMV